MSVLVVHVVPLFDTMGPEWQLGMAILTLKTVRRHVVLHQVDQVDRSFAAWTAYVEQDVSVPDTTAQGRISPHTESVAFRFAPSNCNLSSI